MIFTICILNIKYILYIYIYIYIYIYMQIFEHLHIFKHFKSEGYIDFLENVSVTFIDKTDLQITIFGYILLRPWYVA